MIDIYKNRNLKIYHSYNMWRLWLKIIDRELYSRIKINNLM